MAPLEHRDQIPQVVLQELRGEALGDQRAPHAQTSWVPILRVDVDAGGDLTPEMLPATPGSCDLGAI